MLWGLLFAAVVLQVGEPGVGLGLLTTRGTSAAEIALPILSCHAWIRE